MASPSPDTIDSKAPRWWRPLLVVLVVASIAMAGIALTMKVADLDVDTRVGTIDFQLDTDWKAGSVTYTGSAADFGVNVEGEQVLLEGTGDFQEAVGFLKGTSKRVTNVIAPYTTDVQGKRATLNVTTSTDTIPWWVVGVETPTTVEVKVIGMSNVSSLRVDRVYLELRRHEGGQVLTREVWSKEVDDALVNVGDRLVYETELSVNEDLGEFQVFGMVEVTMVDTNGVTATNVYTSYSTEPKAITIWTIPTFDGVQIAMVIVAMPIYIIGMLVGVAAAVAIVLGKRGRFALPVLAAVLLALGAIFFMMGVSQLADLVGYPDDLSMGVGFYIMLAGFVPALVVGVMVWYGDRRYGVSKDLEEDGSAETINTVDTQVSEEDER